MCIIYIIFLMFEAGKRVVHECSMYDYECYLFVMFNCCIDLDR